MDAELSALLDRVRDLERRVSALERSESLLEIAPAPAPASPVPSLDLPTEAIPMAGFALLGIAGAYLLRALTELRALPQGAGVAIGIVYAAAWLWLAARTPATRRIAVALRVATSILIFAPLVWESAVRFRLLPDWSAAAIVCGFSMAAETVSWRKNLKTIAVMVPAACALLAFALLIGAYDLAPFTLALLVMAASMEFAALEDRGSAGRWIVAACADAAVLILVGVLRRPEGLPEGYVAVSLSLGAVLAAFLLAIYLASAAIDSLVFGRLFSVLQIGQTAAAYIIGLAGFALLTGWRIPVAAFALTTGAAAYWIAARSGPGRNRSIYAAFGLLLFAAAPFAAPGNAAPTAWCVLAVLAAFANIDDAGDIHAAVLLWLALAVTRGESAFVIPAGAFAYWRAQRKVSAFFLAAAATTSAIILVAGMLSFAPLPTLVMIAAALAFAVAGTARARRELIWLTYCLMAAAGFRLLTRHFIAASKLELVGPLLLYGAALVLLPRILKRSQPAPAPAAGTPPHRSQTGARSSPQCDAPQPHSEPCPRDPEAAHTRPKSQVASH